MNVGSWYVTHPSGCMLGRIWEDMWERHPGEASARNIWDTTREESETDLGDLEGIWKMDLEGDTVSGKDLEHHLRDTTWKSQKGCKGHGSDLGSV